MHPPRPLSSERIAASAGRRATSRLAGRTAIAIASLVLASACSGPKSTLEPHGPHAALIAETWWVMFTGGTVIFVVVSALALYAIYRRPDRRASVRPRALVIGGGLVFPIVTLTALLVYGTGVGVALLAVPDTPPLRIHVTGQQFWWEVVYPDGDGAPAVATANELYVPVGQPVEVLLETRDVIHSFWVPKLAGKVDLIPGTTNSLRFSADRPGVFLARCAEFCGLLHAHMRLVVVALDADAFARWRTQRAGPADRRPLAEHAAALADFTRLGCADCHRIGGTAAGGDGGPDLTWFGARIDPAQIETPAGRPQLAVWLRERHAIELMRRHGEVGVPDADEAEALARLLESLR